LAFSAATLNATNAGVARIRYTLGRYIPRAVSFRKYSVFLFHAPSDASRRSAPARPCSVLLRTFLATHIVIAVAAAGLLAATTVPTAGLLTAAGMLTAGMLTATAMLSAAVAIALTLLAGLIALASLVLPRLLLALGLVSRLLRGPRFLGAVRHTTSSDVEALPR
jgi:hypothetical protein